MESIRGTVLCTVVASLAILLAAGSLALPPPSSPLTPFASSTRHNHSRGTVKAKQTTPGYLAEGKSTTGATIPGDTTSKTASFAASAATIANDPTITPAAFSSLDTSTVAGEPPFVDAAPTSTLSGGAFPTSEETERRATSHASNEATTPASKAGPDVGTSAVPIETSSRTMASLRDGDDNDDDDDNDDGATPFSASKKSTMVSVIEATTTATSISGKETRESAGKIRPQIKLTTNYTSVGETGVRLPEGASAALAKPTKYHYYPHNQHIYLLPECAVQQVCNAVYVRLNYTQPLCACPGRYRDPCSASLDSDDLHTTELVTDPRTKALTLVKTCEPVAEMRECRTPRDWSLLALQNVRTGKSHYLVICRCPDANILEGPMSHDQPTYASVPGIRVYGMMCVQGNRRGRPLRYARSLSGRAEDRYGEDRAYEEREKGEETLRFPWYKVQQLMDAAIWD